MKRKVSLFLITLLTSFFIFGSPASAFVNEGWDWHFVNGNKKRTVHYCAGVAAKFTETNRTVDVESVKQGIPLSWAGWLTEAAQILNNSNTGWQLTPSNLSFPPCQILIVLADITEATHGGGVATPVDINGDGKVDLVRIVIDSQLEDTVKQAPEDQDVLDGNRDGWSTLGGEQTRDPIGVMVHELMHGMRLDHHSDSSQTDTSDTDISDPRKVGDHNTTLSQEDLQELRDSYDTQERIGRFEIPQDGQDIKYANIGLSFPQGSFVAVGMTDINIYNGVAIPDPLALPQDYGHILNGAAYIRTSQELQKPMTVNIVYSNNALKGGDGIYVGDLHNFIPSKTQEESIKAFVYVMEPFGVDQEGTSHWELIDNSVVDTRTNTVSFETTETGIFGLAGMEEIEATESGTLNAVGPLVQVLGPIAIIGVLSGVGYFFVRRQTKKLQRMRDELGT